MMLQTADWGWHKHISTLGILKPAAIHSTIMLIANCYSPLEVKKYLAHLKQEVKRMGGDRGHTMTANAATRDWKLATVDTVSSPGTWTGTRPRGRKTPRCPGELPPAWRRGSAPPLQDTAAPWRCAYPSRAEVQATAGWERTAAVPPEVYRCSAAANEQAADPHYRRDLETDIKHGTQWHLLR